MQYRGHQFMLSRNPSRPAYWTGWIIHGDKHNNHLDEYPFINLARMTVNVSAEVVDYKPISIDVILSEISNLGSTRDAGSTKTLDLP